MCITGVIERRQREDRDEAIFEQTEQKKSNIKLKQDKQIMPQLFT